MSMSKLGLALSGSLLLAAVQACVPRQTYETHVSELNETVAQREKEIAELREYKFKYEQIKAENELLSVQRSAYDELSKDIREALESLKDQGIERDKDTGAWVMGTDFLFKSGGFEISTEGQKALRSFVAAWKGKDVRFRIVGHTDVDPIVQVANKVKSKTNLELAFMRAMEVVYLMVKEGVKETKLWAESKGMSEPKATPPTSAAAKKKNRRVEIYVLSGTSVLPASGSR